MILLNGADIAGYMKENQAHTVRSLRSKKIFPKLAIIRDSDAPVITKYVDLKKQYGADIGVDVEDWKREDLVEAIREANERQDIHGIIVQLPIQNRAETDMIVQKIKAQKDVDGLAQHSDAIFDSATATAINWLLAGYDIDLANEKIAMVGYGKLIGAPLTKMWQASGYDVTVFEKGQDLSELQNYSLIISATGVPHLIKSPMVRAGAIIVDAGTASEGGVLVGDVDDSVRQRSDLKAITPKIGGVGPLTVTALFEHVLIAASNSAK